MIWNSQLRVISIKRLTQYPKASITMQKWKPQQEGFLGKNLPVRSMSWQRHVLYLPCGCFIKFKNTTERVKCLKCVLVFYWVTGFFSQI